MQLANELVTIRRRRPVSIQATSTPPHENTVLAVDLGKTSCRAQVVYGHTVMCSVHGPGAPSLADYGGEQSAYLSITNALSQLSDTVKTRITHCGIGAAGVESGRAAARLLRKRLHETLLQVPVAIINDALAAHIGAFAGGTGTTLITGTGAVAYGLGADGLLKQVDGWGPWLGDEGGGRWIGEQGLQHALRYADKRGAYTSLLDAVTTLTGNLGTLPQWVSETGEPARRLASFAPVVLDHARAGDIAAAGIVGKATDHLAAAAAASPHGSPVAVIGGLFEHPYFHDHLKIALMDRGLRVVDPLGGPLAGAAILAVNSQLPHERHVTRD